jgi:hypothetical protein
MIPSFTGDGTTPAVNDFVLYLYIQDFKPMTYHTFTLTSSENGGDVEGEQTHVSRLEYVNDSEDSGIVTIKASNGATLNYINGILQNYSMPNQVAEDGNHHGTTNLAFSVQYLYYASHCSGTDQHDGGTSPSPQDCIVLFNPL